MLKINFTPFPLIKTPRLVLRRIRISDVQELFFLRSNKQVLKYIDRIRDKSVEQSLAHIKKLEKFEKAGDGINWAITLKGNDTMLGLICLFNIKKDHRRAELGYMLHPDYYGQGIMSEAIKTVLETGFRKYKFHSIEAIVNPKNKVSIRLLEKNKFNREAYFKENYFYNGKFLDSAVYSLLASSVYKREGK
jgi:[ribosomal protein S5]-alanine N-acetyltransferase